MSRLKEKNSDMQQNSQVVDGVWHDDKLKTNKCWSKAQQNRNKSWRILCWTLGWISLFQYITALWVCESTKQRADVEAFTFSTHAKPSEALHIVIQNI